MRLLGKALFLLGNINVTNNRMLKTLLRSISDYFSWIFFNFLHKYLDHNQPKINNFLKDYQKRHNMQAATVGQWRIVGSNQFCEMSFRYLHTNNANQLLDKKIASVQYIVEYKLRGDDFYYAAYVPSSIFFLKCVDSDKFGDILRFQQRTRVLWKGTGLAPLFNRCYARRIEQLVRDNE